MKITDMNVSVGNRDCNGKVIDAEYIMDWMSQYRIDHVACYNYYATLNPKLGNTEMVEIAAKSNGKIGACVVLDPIMGAENLPGEGTLVERLQELKPACLRVFPNDARVVFHPFYWSEILEAAEALSMPLLIDGAYNDTFFCILPEISKQYPNIKFVLLREGLCLSRRIYPLLKKCKNVYFTMERMLDYQGIEEIDALYGCDKLLLGSGFPERPVSGALGLAIYANISQENRDKILHENWERIRYDNI